MKVYELGSLSGIAILDSSGEVVGFDNIVGDEMSDSLRRSE